MILKFNYPFEPYEFRDFVERRTSPITPHSTVIDKEAIIYDWKLWINEYPRNKFETPIIT